MKKAKIFKGSFDLSDAPQEFIDYLREYLGDEYDIRLGVDHTTGNGGKLDEYIFQVLIQHRKTKLDFDLRVSYKGSIELMCTGMAGKEWDDIDLNLVKREPGWFGFDISNKTEVTRDSLPWALSLVDEFCKTGIASAELFWGENSENFPADVPHSMEDFRDVIHQSYA